MVMKNIHVLKTDKPTRLFTSDSVLILAGYPATTFKTGKNIYITSDEEIKEGDWHLAWLRDSWEVLNYMPSIGYRKECLGKEVCKIILTTDQDLIKDGVHAIDDEFLEWFVNNPSCEEVEVEIDSYMDKNISESEIFTNYKIIIPKEEPKQRLEKYSERFDNDKSPIGNPETWGKRMVEEPKQEIDISKYIVGIDPYDEPKQETLEEETKCYCGHTTYCDCGPEQDFKDIELPQQGRPETLEEAAEKYPLINQRIGFKLGAKWQQERSYSEDEVLETIRQYALEEHLITSSKPDIWFKKFKKKSL
jgi:hypothetical protein